MTAPRRALAAAFVAAAAVATQGCDSGPQVQGEVLEGEALVGGEELWRHGLLVVPRAGGRAEFRTLQDPGTVIWTGRLRLPPVTAARSAGSAAVLVSGGRAYLYHGAPESLDDIGAVPDDFSWVSFRGGVSLVGQSRAIVVYRDDGTGDSDGAVNARQIRATGDAAGEVIWAAAAEEGAAVALVETENGRRLVRWGISGSEPDTSIVVEGTLPATLAGWGGEVLLTRGDRLDRWSIGNLQPLTSASTPDGTVDLDGEPGWLATSPSEHRVLVARPADRRIDIYDRYDWGRVASIRTEGPVSALRTSPVTGQMLVFDGEAAWLGTVEGGDPQRLPGEWRDDLPLALLGGRALTVDGERLVLAGGGSHDPAAGDQIAGPPDAWWLPLRWGPRLPVASAPEPEPVDEGVAELGGRTIGLLTMGRPASAALAAVLGGLPGDSAEDDPDGDPAPPGRVGEPAVTVPGPGWYAVARSSETATDLLGLRDSLLGVGYSVIIAPRRGPGGRVTYLLLTGPYDQVDAEMAALELQIQAGIDAWVYEVLRRRESR